MESARPAVPGDLACIADLAAQFARHVRTQRGGELWAAREAHPAPDAAAIAAAAGGGVLVLTGCIDRVVVGYAHAELEPLDGGPLARLLALYVEPAARGVGVGSALLDAVGEWAEQRGARGIDAIALPGDRAAKNFFEMHGLVARAIVVHRTFEAGA